MKILHFSDAHIDFGANMGTTDPYTRMSTRVMDCLDMFDSIIEFAEAEKVDIILFAGDAFHRYNPNPIYLNEFAKRVMRMQELCPVVLLVGNHDLSPITSAVEIYNSLHIQNVIVGNDYQVYRIDVGGEVVQIATAPYPDRKLLQDKKKFMDIIYHLGDTITDEGPAILLGHFTVGGSKFGAERDYIFNKDAEVDLETVADETWDYVALGHIHSHQCLNDNPPVVYAGSIDRVTFGEEHEDKGFVVITIEDGVTSWEFIQTDARPYTTLEVTSYKKNVMDKVLAKIQEHDLSRSVVRVIINVDEHHRSLIDRQAILHALDEADVYMLTDIIIKTIKVEMDDEARIDENIFNVTMSHEELLKNYLEYKEVDPKEIKKIVKVARGIMEEVNNA